MTGKKEVVLLELILWGRTGSRPWSKKQEIKERIFEMMMGEREWTQY